LIREKIKLEKGSGKPNTEKVGKITMDQIKEIVEIKKGELNAIDEAGACKQIAGTARSMGVEVVE
jgi:large subunit ribosomal protein L11